jgi:hypothetical protein
MPGPWIVNPALVGWKVGDNEGTRLTSLWDIYV